MSNPFEKSFEFSLEPADIFCRLLIVWVMHRVADEIYRSVVSPRKIITEPITMKRKKI